MGSQDDGAIMSAKRETVARILKMFEKRGWRSTHQRRLMAEEVAGLAGTGVDFTAQELWRLLQRADPELGRATVYRMVDALLDEGVLNRVSFPDGSHRFRVCADTHHHHHLTCVGCQRVVEVDACLSTEALAAISASTDFAIEGHSLELFGRCADCRHRRPGAPDMG